MFTVTLTGGIGSGKTTVSDRFAAHGVPVIDADKLAHLVTAPGGAAIEPIRTAFGAAFIAADGSLARAVMRERVFSDPAARRQLEAITHPLIRAERERAIDAAVGPYLLIATPLFAEARSSGPRRDRATRVLVVDCSVDTQIERVMRRNGLDRQQVQAIIATQATREQRLACADDVIWNDQREIADLHLEIDRLHHRYLGFAAPQA
jgi:dephospho-CoA kinase